MIKKTLLALLICFAAALPAFAESDSSLNVVVSALEKAYSSLQDVQATFSQKTKIASMGREQKGSGELFLKKPASTTASFRFNYNKPKQQIISNGKQVWFYMPENRQVMVSSVQDMFKGGNSIALSYLTGLGHVSKDFSAAFSSEKQDKDGNYQLELTPKKPTPVLSKLSLTVSKEAVEAFRKDGAVTGIFPVIASTVHDAAGNQTRIDYSGTKVNVGVSSSKFSFTPPQGTQVIKP